MSNLPPNPDGFGQQQPQPTQTNGANLPPQGAYGQNVPPQGAYGQPAPDGYGLPPYAQSNFQAPAYAGYFPYPYATMVPYNTLAIVGFILAFVFSPAGIVCSAIALRQIKRSGERGHSLALAGVIVGAVFTAFLALYIIFIIVMLIIEFSVVSSTASYGINS